MSEEKPIILDPAIIEKFKAIQCTANYMTNSTVRFWLNYQTEDYFEHWHLDLEMIIPIENNYTVIVDGKTYVLNPGEILIIPPGVSHKLVSPGSGMRLIYIMTLSVLANIIGYSLLTTYLAKPVLINSQTYPEIYDKEISIILELFHDYVSDDALREFVIYPKLIEFFSIFAHYQFQKESGMVETQPVADKQRVQTDQLNFVLSYIDMHFTEDLTLDHVANVAGFSKYHFSRLFKEHSGQNFYEYLCFRRIKSAETLLLMPEISITEVALRSGFASLSTFNRIFKKTKKCTPSHYRQLYTSPLSPFISYPNTPRGIEHVPE